MADTGQEKSEKATGKRRQEARQRGQVASSREIPSTLVLLTALAAFHFAGDQLVERLQGLLNGMFRSLNTGRVTTINDAHTLMIDLLLAVWSWVSATCSNYQMPNWMYTAAPR